MGAGQGTASSKRSLCIDGESVSLIYEFRSEGLTISMARVRLDIVPPRPRTGPAIVSDFSQSVGHKEGVGTYWHFFVCPANALDLMFG